MSTNRTNLIVALVAVAALAVGCKQDRPAAGGSGEGKAPGDLPLPRKLPPAPPPSAQPPPPAHGAEIDTSYATVLAMYNAPEGATPCESAYNSVVAEQDAARTMKRESIFKFVAAKDVFLKLCHAFPAASQQCLIPKYEARNREACRDARAPAEQIKALYVIREDLDQPAEPGQIPPQP
jgi:hypothetical protein